MKADLPVPVSSWAGVDEVGRGALFGPVVASAVFLTEDIADDLWHRGVTDSKKLTVRKREQLAGIIVSKAIDTKIGIATVYEVDRLNVLNASLLAMKRALQQLAPQPLQCRVDGNQAIPHISIPQDTVVRGDQTDCAIAAASIVAKVWRDKLMVRLDKHYPGYGLANNKGYGSEKHRQALLELGPCRQHRLSFRPCAVASQIVLQLK